MDGPPPPPPPHGSNPKTTGGSHGKSGGLPDGNYDIFIIPPHASGGGFLYLPSLQVQWVSFSAGVASTIVGLIMWNSVEPTMKQWFRIVSQGMSSGGNPVVVMVMMMVGCLCWILGKAQTQGGAFNGFGGGPSGNGPGAGAGAGAGTGPSGYQRAPPPPPNGGFPGAGGPPPQGAHGGWYGGRQHQQHSHDAPPQDDDDEDTWQGSQPDPQAHAEWAKAREETRKREEERKQAEEAEKKREEERKAKEEADRQARAKAEKEKWERMRAREREQREREARERIAKDKAQREKEAKEKEQKEKEAKEAEERTRIEREIREKLEAEQKAKAAEEAKKRAAEAREAHQRKLAEEKAAAEAAAAKAKADAERAERLKAARERAQRDREARVKAEADKIKTQTATASAPDPSAGRRSTTYGGSGGGERLDPYAGVKSPPSPSVTSTHSSPIKATVTPKKNYEKPSAKSYLGTEDVHSFRPYDTPKRPAKAPSYVSSQYSESSYAPSQSTSRTTPPPSHRGPYSTNDPDKIVIKAVYLFNDLFPKPVAQLVAGIGKVTDGLILKIQTEGLFIDDDVRNIPQREWDVKAWTLKLIETGQQSDKHLHILRASIRDTDGKKYVFLIDESESWKVALGIGRLRKGSQVRSLQNSQISPNEMKKLLSAVPPLPA